jgi:hypothetical protein
MLMMYMNLAILMYQAHFRPFEINLMNKVEVMNECFITTYTVSYLFFSDWVPNLEDV